MKLVLSLLVITLVGCASSGPVVQEPQIVNGVERTAEKDHWHSVYTNLPAEIKGRYRNFDPYTTPKFGNERETKLHIKLPYAYPIETLEGLRFHYTNFYRGYCPERRAITDYVEDQLRLKKIPDQVPERLSNSDQEYLSAARTFIWKMRKECGY